MFILTWLYIGITLEFCPFFWDILDEGAFESPYFFYTSFLFFFLINYIVIIWKESFNNNKDLLYKFVYFFFRPFSLFITYILGEIKRFYVFLIKFEYKIFFKTVYDLIFLKLGGFFLIWRPLFRKWSYFGYFRSNRSKWWKNK